MSNDAKSLLFKKSEEDLATVSDADIEREILQGDQRMWSVSGASYFPCDKTEEALPPGQYIPMYNENRGVYFTKKSVNLDDLLVLPDSKTEQILDSIADFWKRERYFREHGFLWKRGTLMWGPPGSGKTSCLQQLAAHVIEHQGVAVYCTSPAVTAEALRIMRRIEPHRPVIVMIEDIDAIIQRYGEPDLLALLDGELQIDNVVYIATTNYPEELDKRFIQRPSRFDEVIYVGMPNDEARRVYLMKKNPRLQSDRDELDLWVSLTKRFSIAALKEMVVAVECLGREVEPTAKRLRQLLEKKPTSEDSDDKQMIGFTSGFASEDD